MKPMTEKHLALFRRHMVEVVDLHFDLSEDELGKGALGPELRDAMLEVPRHHFVPAQLAAVAYHDGPLPIGFDKTISQPYIGALMLDLLEVRPGHKVLEVGTGYGYQAALLAELGAEVWSVEIVEEFAGEASLRLQQLGYHAVHVRVGDGSRGWVEHAPYDRMVVPLGPKEVQQLSVVTKTAAGDPQIREVIPVRFTQLEI
jgi:protein-L-isoaspartate(D-aspartate) O-methyltransferase